jgi:hypothetical protein
MRKLAAAFAVLVGLTLALGQACNSTGPTAPDAVTQTGSVSSGPVASAVTPTPIATPTPAAPVGDRPYVEFYPPAGDGRFCNPMGHPLTLKVEYWNANVFTKQTLLETREFTAQPKTCVPIPPVSEIVKLACGDKVKVQVDAATTEHLGHIFVDLVGPEEKETVTEVVTYGPWSECKAVATADSKEQCQRTRTKTVTVTKSYVCKEPVVEVKTSQESEPCECACVPEWKELPPVVTKGEWSECKQEQDDKGIGVSCQPKCYQSRKVRTLIEEENSCTKARRVKSDTTETEKRECPCKIDCVRPVEGKVLSWEGRGDPETECKAFEEPGLYGPYDDDEVTPTWFICKSGNDREVMYTYPTGATCANGKDISHVTGCDCATPVPR